MVVRCVEMLIVVVGILSVQLKTDFIDLFELFGDGVVHCFGHWFGTDTASLLEVELAGRVYRTLIYSGLIVDLDTR